MKLGKKIAALCAAVAMAISFTACEVVSVNRKKDMAQVVADINGKKITKQEVYDAAAPALEQEGIDIMDEKLSSEVRQSIDGYTVDVLNALIEEKIVEHMFDEKKLEITEEDKKEIDEEAEEYFDLLKMYMLGYDKDNPDDYDGDIEADLDEKLEEMGLTREEYKEDLINNKKTEKLREETTKDTQASEGKIKERYDKDLKEQRDTYSGVETEEETETPAIDGMEQEKTPEEKYKDLAQSCVVYKPQGYRLVKHILLDFTDEDKEKLEEFDNKIQIEDEKMQPHNEVISEAQTILGETQEEIAELEVAEEKDEQAFAKLQETVQEQEGIIEKEREKMQPFEQTKEDLQKEKDEYRQQAAKNLEPTVQEIVKKYENGTDFNELVDEYNTDEGMESETGKAYGYLLDEEGSGFVSEFSEAALKLTEPGQLSGAVLTEFGVHILRLEYGEQEAELKYDLVKPILKETVDEEAKEEKWEKSLEEWEKQLKVKRWEKRLKFIVR